MELVARWRLKMKEARVTQFSAFVQCVVFGLVAVIQVVSLAQAWMITGTYFWVNAFLTIITSGLFAFAVVQLWLSLRRPRLERKVV